MVCAIIFRPKGNSNGNRADFNLQLCLFLFFTLKLSLWTVFQPLLWLCWTLAFNWIAETPPAWCFLDSGTFISLLLWIFLSLAEIPFSVLYVTTPQPVLGTVFIKGIKLIVKHFETPFFISRGKSNPAFLLLK